MEGDPFRTSGGQCPMREGKRPVTGVTLEYGAEAPSENEPTSSGDVTRLLQSARAGDRAALDRLSELSITRDYGETANEKANELLFHLALATVSIVRP